MWELFIFGPIIVVCFLAFFIAQRRTLKKNFTPYQSVLSFGLYNFGILCLLSFGAILLLILLYGGGDTSGMVAMVFLFPIAGVATLAEMLVVFFIFRGRYQAIITNFPGPEKNTTLPKQGSKAKIIIILLLIFVGWMVLSMLAGFYKRVSPKIEFCRQHDCSQTPFLQRYL